jgi:hypothetical protein
LIFAIDPYQGAEPDDGRRASIGPPWLNPPATSVKIITILTT